MQGVSEDEVAFMEDGKLRVLRGTVIGEDEHFVHVSRNDGDWSINKAQIVKIQRRRGGT